MPSILVNGFLFLVSFFVFLVGMVGLNFYSESKTESRVSRLNYTSFVGYVLGLGTILFYIGTMNSMGLSASFITGFMSFTTLLVWTMCAMMLSDMKKENKDNTQSYTFTSWMLGINLILWLGFSVLTFSPAGRLLVGKADGGMIVGPAPVMPVMRFGNRDLNSPLYGFSRQ